MINYYNHFLFSDTYIKEYLRDQKKKSDFNEIVNAKLTQVKEWNADYESGDLLDDPWSDYIDAVLDVLEFKRDTDDSFRLLYTNSLNNGKPYVATCYVIDKDEDVGSTKKGKYHAYNAVNVAKKYGAYWAMLTNGFKWRLYNIENVSPYENYFEVDITNIQDDELNDAFHLFYLFFGVQSYFTDENGELYIEKIKEASDAKAEIIEETLRGKSEEILKELCYGLKENMGKDNFTEKERKAIYNDAIILLYRLLFFGYAESRRLLPVTDGDPEYTDSFFGICEDAKERYNNGEIIKIKDDFEYWYKLNSYLRIYVDNSYNGGLFSNENKPILKNYRISNGRLAKCLVELTFNINKQGIYKEKIEYRDLSVRNLGSIYEGILEYQLFIAEERMVQRKSKGKVKYIRAANTTLKNTDLKNIIEKGEIYLSQDAIERKETGAYYTPEDVVQYIVDNTVGKKLDELKLQLYEQKKDLLNKLSYEPMESMRKVLQNEIDKLTLSFIEKNILSISIIDSAMGSGHFLVNATHKMANGIVEMLSENNWECNCEYLIDITYWKREVVENCIYGIDINGLSVALAQLSLWLISASNDKALSFVDHHLKEGNSIVGTDRYHVEINEHSLFDYSYENYMKPVLEKYNKIKNAGSNTKADVMRQIEVYSEINEQLSLVKKKYDYYLASQYAGGIKNRIRYDNLLRSRYINDFENEEMNSLWKTAEEMKFFHWELEFPEVLTKDGFDIVIGNPPYIDVSESEYKHTIIKHKTTRNLYSYMIDNNLKFVNQSDFSMSYIVPLSIICSKRMMPLRSDIIEKYNEVSFANIDSSSHPGCIFKNVIARLTIINISNKCNSKTKVLKSTDYIKFFSRDRRSLFDNIKFTDVDRPLIIDGIVPKIGNGIEKDILTKVFNKTRKRISDIMADKAGDNYFYYRKLGMTYYGYAFAEPPYFAVNGVQQNSSTLRKIDIKDEVSKYPIICLFYSSLFYWFWTVYSDCYNFINMDLLRIPIDFSELSSQHNEYKKLYEEIKNSMDNNGERVIYEKVKGRTEYLLYKPRYSKSVFDKVDNLLGDYYNFNQDEKEFLINYDIRFRIDEGD